MDMEARADALFGAVVAKDWDGFAAAFAPDALVKHNFDDGQGVPETVAFMQMLDSRGITITYENVRRVVGADVLVEQHDVRMHRADGAEAVLDIAAVMRFDADGLITRLDEYLDPAGAGPLLEP